MASSPAVRRSGPIRGRARSIPAATAVLCVLLAAAGCSAGQRERAATDAASRFVAAVRDGDTAAACGLLAPRTREELGSEGSGCEQALTETNPPVSEVGEVVVWGERAQARTGEGALFLAELADGWKVTAAGCRPRGADLPYLCMVGGS